MNADTVIVVAESDDDETENAIAMAPTPASASTSRQVAHNDCNASGEAAASKDTATGGSCTADDKDQMECPICLQTCIHPARLPCGHVFCFLCVKGVAYKNRRCAMCRREIPIEFLEHPDLLFKIEETPPTTDDGYQWFYEGRNGWWQYDERTSQEIEDAYKRTDKFCTILVAGYVYVVDFETMLQQRQNEPSRKRLVKRDLATIAKKGVAGLRIDGTADPQESAWLGAGGGAYASFDAASHDGGGGDHPTLDGGQDQHANRQPPQARSPLPALVANNLISTIAATDAAIRIASDIIDSTLAHASNDTHSSSATASTAASATPASYDYRAEYGNQSATASASLSLSSSSSSSDGSGGANGGGGHHADLLSEVQMALNMTAGGGGASSTSSSTPRLDFFSQTIDEFRSLALSNIAESDTDSDSDNKRDSDDDDDDYNIDSVVGERRVGDGLVAVSPITLPSADDAADAAVDGVLF